MDLIVDINTRTVILANKIAAVNKITEGLNVGAMFATPVSQGAVIVTVMRTFEYRKDAIYRVAVYTYVTKTGEVGTVTISTDHKFKDSFHHRLVDIELFGADAGKHETIVSTVYLPEPIYARINW